jgi:asparagine synthase (glutamine-hydrolysing)
MGGFILVRKSERIDYKDLQAAALDSFTQRGFANPHIISTENYVLLAFAKRQTSALALERFPNGDFVFACGTLLYDGKVGKAAASAFYEDYDGPPGPRERAMGHYAVILRKNGLTEIIPDSFGGYHIYCDSGMHIATSSFLAAAASLKRLTFSAQSAYEYVFNGVVSGDATLFEEIILAPVGSTISVQQQKMQFTKYPLRIPQTVSHTNFEASITHTMEILDRYFSSVAESFGDSINCALTGGYDSRLILALLRRHGVRPRLYLYGSSVGEDVRLAHAIAKGENLPLDVTDKTQRPIWRPDEFAAIAHQNFLSADGYIWEGIFDNGAESELRALRVNQGRIVLNGGGGEILRNFFYLPDRRYTPREFLWSFYSRFDPRSCTELFDEDDYFHKLELKIGLLTGHCFSSFPRPTVEWLYHNFRCRSWDGRVNTINSSFGYTSLPFLERPLTEHASTIPIEWKNHGAYEAELVRRADKRLAAYPSSYGHDFNGPPPLFRRLADYGTYLRPTWLRRFSYRVQHRMKCYAASSVYLERPYVDAVLPRGAQITPRLFRLERVADPQQMARILTLEYLVQQFAGRVCDDLRKPASRNG